MEKFKFILPVVCTPSFVGMNEQDTAAMQATERISKVFMLTVDGDLVPSEESITPFILKIVEFCLPVRPFFNLKENSCLRVIVLNSF